MSFVGSYVVWEEVCLIYYVFNPKGQSICNHLVKYVCKADRPKFLNVLFVCFFLNKKDMSIFESNDVKITIIYIFEESILYIMWQFLFKSFSNNEKMPSGPPADEFFRLYMAELI